MAQKPLPQRLKRLESSDLLSIKDSNGDFLVVTKQETAKVIKDFIYLNFGEELNEISNNIGSVEKKKLEKIVNQRLDVVEKSIDAFIEYKFTQLAEKVCEMLINRKFLEEVNNRAEKLLEEKFKKGNF